MMEMIEAAFATIKAMRQQEENFYALPFDPSQLQDEHLESVNACRYKMLDWCFKVADYCKYSRETVTVAASYIDRYLALRPIPDDDRRLFQLICMTAFYLAVKINEPEALSPDLMVTMGKDCYTEDDIVAMELDMLKTLEWHVHPPTPQSYIRQFLNMLQDDRYMMDSRDQIIELTNDQVYFAVLTGPLPAWAVGFGAVANVVSNYDNAIKTLVALCQAVNVDLQLLTTVKNHLSWGTNYVATPPTNDGQQASQSISPNHCEKNDEPVADSMELSTGKVIQREYGGSPRSANMMG